MILFKNKKKIFHLLKKKCIILFSSDWCFPCKIIKKNIIKLEKKINFLFFNLNIDLNDKIFLNLNINIIPSILIKKKKKKFLMVLKK